MCQIEVSGRLAVHDVSNGSVRTAGSTRCVKWKCQDDWQYTMCQMEVSGGWQYTMYQMEVSGRLAVHDVSNGSVRTAGSTRCIKWKCQDGWQYTMYQMEVSGRLAVHDVSNGSVRTVGSTRCIKWKCEDGWQYTMCSNAVMQLTHLTVINTIGKSKA